MKKKLLILSLFFLALAGYSQDNCNVYLWEGDTAKFNACEYLQNAPGYFQLRREHHVIRDSAIKIAPHYDYPYWSKSIAYLKTGDFIGWKKLIDKAVELNELKHLGYRGWCRFQFFRDYEGAISDLERLEEIMGTTDTGICQNGKYHLRVAMGLCYKMIGEKQKALEIIKSQIDADPDFVQLFDYLHLGVLYFEMNQLDEAKRSFQLQETINPLAETAFYQSQLAQKEGDSNAALKYAELALERHKQRRFMYDPYGHQVDKVYLSQIEDQIERLKQ